ncbi:MAG: hypothetical protein NC453_17720 [Muribaculum sp.]|nr:hypothetical protein [Muribaculum sp.]
MEDNKKEILNAQIEKLDEILKALKENFDVEKELADEYSFLSIVKSNLVEISK